MRLGKNTIAATINSLHHKRLCKAIMDRLAEELNRENLADEEFATMYERLVYGDKAYVNTRVAVAAKLRFNSDLGHIAENLLHRNWWFTTIRSRNWRRVEHQALQEAP